MKRTISQFSKSALLIILFISFAACGSGGGSGSDSNIVSVDITGNIYNEAGGASLSVENVQAEATVINSPWSTLDDITDPIRLPTISRAQWMIIETTIKNTSTTDLKGYGYRVQFEDAGGLTPESWICYKRFARLDGGGDMGTSVWEVYGGTLTEPIAPPVLPDCPGEYPDPPGGCDPAFYDCDNLWYAISYEPPGNGLSGWYSMIANLPAGESHVTSDGMSISTIDVRPDHYARFQAVDSELNVLDQQDYVFDIVH